MRSNLLIYLPFYLFLFKKVNLTMCHLVERSFWSQDFFLPFAFIGISAKSNNFILLCCQAPISAGGDWQGPCLMDYLPVPQGSYEEEYKKFHRQRLFLLGGGVGTLTVSLLMVGDIMRAFDL